jgi:hypothetical protein
MLTQLRLAAHSHQNGHILLLDSIVPYLTLTVALLKYSSSKPPFRFAQASHIIIFGSLSWSSLGMRIRSVHSLLSG